MNGDQMNGTGSDKTRKSAMNGKSKGFGNFFKRGSAKKAEKTSIIQGVLPSTAIREFKAAHPT